MKSGSTLDPDSLPARAGGDIGFDRVVGPDEAGLGGGPDHAEEARLGITDEELERRLRRR
jgi:hypothetical protein